MAALLHTVGGSAGPHHVSTPGQEVHPIADFPPLDLLYLYREQVHSILAGHDMSHPRIVGLAARGSDMPSGWPIEILVSVLEFRERPAVDLHRAAEDLAELIGHEVVLQHCEPGNERLLEGDEMRPL
ncbi:MAG: hypothetical protein LCH96_16825 [Actinobacteria bacterium]|nr:hypothetical protein [Actinomycetota bacterium]